LKGLFGNYFGVSKILISLFGPFVIFWFFISLKGEQVGIPPISTVARFFGQFTIYYTVILDFGSKCKILDKKLRATYGKPIVN
jgi:hypothetical protein